MPKYKISNWYSYEEVFIIEAKNEEDAENIVANGDESLFDENYKRYDEQWENSEITLIEE